MASSSTPLPARTDMSPAEPKHAQTRLWNFKTSRLETFAIAKLPRYVAVSHVWTEQFFPRHAIRTNDCDGMSMVQAVLNEPRYKNLRTVGHIWVDSWCIEQDNEVDKNTQIPHMGRIYETAVATIIPTREVFDWTQMDWDQAVEVVRNEASQANVPYISLSSVLRDTRRQLKLSEPTLHHLRKVPGIMNEIARLSWSKRIWTAQEYLKSSHSIWVDADRSMLEFTAQDIQCAFFAFLEWNERLGTPGVLDRGSFNRAIDAISFNNFQQLVQTKLAPHDSPSFMAQAISRACSQPEDVVYGLMSGTGVVIKPRLEETAVEAWDRWWLAAVQKSGMPMLYAGVVRRTKRTTPEAMEHRDCLKISFDERCEALSVSAGMRHRLDRPCQYVDGSLVAEGRIAGEVTVLAHLKFGPQDVDYNALITVLSGRFEIAFTLCKFFGKKGPGYWKECYDLAIFLSSGSSDAIGGSMSTFRGRFLQSLRVWKTYQLPHQLYLCQLRNNLTETTCLLRTGDELPMGPLLALDFDTTAGDQPDWKHLVIVRRPEVGNGLSNTFHKLGLTNRIWFPKGYPPDQVKAEGGHINDSASQVMRIGGRGCVSCENAGAYLGREKPWEEVFIGDDQQDVEDEKMFQADTVATVWGVQVGF